MAKLAPGVRLLRTLVRSAKSQKKLIGALLPKPAKPARKAARSHAPAPGQWLAARYRPAAAPGVPGMRYWLYLPQNVPDEVAQHGWPLVVMLHGCQQTAPEFAQGTRMNRLAEQKGYAVLYPQQPAGVQAQRCWRWYDGAVQQGGGETALLAALIGHLAHTFPIDTRRIYACGLSAGAGMAAVLALNHPELIAAIGVHSGPVFGAGHGAMGALQVMRYGAVTQAGTAIAGVLERRSRQGPAPRPMPPMPALLVQGEDDHVVRGINQHQLARQWLQVNGLADGPATRVTVKPAGKSGRGNAHTIHDYLVGRKLVLRVVRIAGLGHAWSGGDPALKFNAKAGPDASRMMLEFFGRHRRHG